ncbi:MAG TPA: UTRA domain-containing protein [Methylomirabilota bacterium]|nr:UTRA domain-containing protein [Methylomirabilota bacterium]
MASRVPRYHQIAQTLRERIVAGGHGPGKRLDNQRSLAREFGVTLMTLRQALDLLERDGLIARRHGLGTFIARPSIDYDILHLRALAGDLSALGEDVATRFVRSYKTVADRRIAEALRLRERAPVFVLERLRLVDGEPVSFQASYLPAVIGEEVSKADLAVTPLRQVLSFKLGIEITGAHETVSAVPLDRRAAREMGCRPGTAAFRSDRISTGADGTPIVYDRVFIPGDRFRITRQLRYDTLNGHTEALRVTDESDVAPLAEPEAVRIGTRAKEPGRPTEVFDVQATETSACAKEPGAQLKPSTVLRPSARQFG